MQIVIAKTEQEFLDLKPEWDQLSIEPFKSWDWNYRWWKHFGETEQLCIVAARMEGRLVGVAPFQLQKSSGEKKLQFFGGGRVCTDYVQLIIEKELEDQFWNQLAINVKNNESDLFGTTLIEFEGASITSAANVSDGLDGSFWNYQSELNSTWVVPLPGSWDEFVQSRNKSLRRKIRKAEKRFASGRARVRSTSKGLDFDLAFDTLVELHQERFVSKGEPGVFSESRFTDFLRSTAKALSGDGRAEILLCDVDGGPIVAQLYWLNSNGPQLYQSGIRIDSMSYEPGHLLFTHAFKEAIKNGYEQFDFLRGNEAYKLFWGGKQVPLYLSRFVSHGLVSTLRHQLIKRLKETKRWLKNSPLFQRNKLVRS